jgi:hypothetical protein
LRKVCFRERGYFPGYQYAAAALWLDIQGILFTQAGGILEQFLTSLEFKVVVGPNSFKAAGTIYGGKGYVYYQ